MEVDKKNCPMCGEAIMVTAIKCKHCGSMLNTPASTSAGSSTSEKYFCPSCKAEVAKDSSCCTACNADFSGAGGWKPLSELDTKLNRDQFPVVGTIALVIAILSIFSPFIVAQVLVPAAFILGMIAVFARGELKTGAIAIFITIFGAYGVYVSYKNIEKGIADLNREIKNIEAVGKKGIVDLNREIKNMEAEEKKRHC